MLKIYTSGNSYEAIKSLDTTYAYPEEKRSPYEQINWLNNHLKEFQTKDVSIKTFSPYILNYINLLLARGDLNFDNIEVFEYYYEEPGFIDFTSLKIEGHNMIDTRFLSDPISEIYCEFNKIKNMNS